MRDTTQPAVSVMTAVSAPVRRPPRRTPMVDLGPLMRPRQWAKNLLVVPLAALDGLVT